jgi:uncharacterized protein (TIGR00159 family)
MFDTARTIVVDLWTNLRATDVIDVVVVTAFVYAAIKWFRRARSRFVLIGIALLALLYGVARALSLALTLALFQAGITVALVAVVVIFQEEIRRAFERIATTRPLPRRRNAPKSLQGLDAFVEAVSTLARSRTGALIVFKGREPLDRHLSGGIVLEGHPSPQLLLSIFDASSPGHDGAVIVEGGFVRAFGAHLPLSTRVPSDARYGTRHTAALGLSECSDALVVVVSEERGTTSIAHDGALRAVESSVTLRKRLETHLRALQSDEEAAWWWSALSRNLGAKAFAFAIALATWVLMVGQQGTVVARSYTVPVTYRDVPAAIQLEQPNPMDVRVTLAGSDRAFQHLDTDTLAAAVDTKNVRPGAQRIRLDARNLQLPDGLTLHSIDPDFITLVAHPTVVRRLPVRPRTSGQLPAGVWLKSIKVNPETVQFILKKSESGNTKSVSTEWVELDGVKTTKVVDIALTVPQDARLADGEPSAVQVTLEVLPRAAPSGSK